MKAAVFKGKGHINVIDTEKPGIQDPEDAIVKVMYTTVCGTDLHMYHGKMPAEKNHTFGHEMVGIVEEVGPEVTYAKPGDRVVATATIACGKCEFCKMGEYSQCINANPNFPEKGSALFGNTPIAGGYQGVQAEYVRVPYANTVLFKVPDEITDKQALTLSDILPTGYYGTDLVELHEGDSLVIYGAGPVGQMAAISAKLKGANPIYIVDSVPARLRMAQEHAGAIPINYKEVDPVKEIKGKTNKMGVAKAIDAVGMEAETNWGERIEEAVKIEPSSGKAIRWAIESVRRSGMIALIGFYAGWINHFPIDPIFYNNLVIKGGNCPHRRYMEILTRYIQEGKLDPSFVFTKEYNLIDIAEAYKCFDNEREECIKTLVKAA